MLIAVDLDGTLFNKRSEVSGRTINSLLAAEAAGHIVVAVTGRSWRTCIERLKRASPIRYVVCSNGAYAYDVVNSSIIWSKPMDPKASMEAMKRIRNKHKQASFGWESSTGISYERAFLEQADDPSTLEHGGNGGVLGQSELLAIYIRVPGLDINELQESITELAGDVFCASTSGAPFLDATARDVDKASGLAAAAAFYNVEADDVMSFGDNLNDLPMLHWAGTAVAMGNAHPSVRQMADSITVSNNRDGVAVYIDRFLKAPMV